jgi:hypothetical protein
MTHWEHAGCAQNTHATGDLTNTFHWLIKENFLFRISGFGIFQMNIVL